MGPLLGVRIVSGHRRQQNQTWPPSLLVPIEFNQRVTQKHVPRQRTLKISCEGVGESMWVGAGARFWNSTGHEASKVILPGAEAVSTRLALQRDAKALMGLFPEEWKQTSSFQIGP